ncbi:MAG: erythromycin esterase family protein [Candidatus Latescibacter sp.]|nr:erythromycin esterase family protein [Candidatus Latescibacter sp.]
MSAQQFQRSSTFRPVRHHYSGPGWLPVLLMVGGCLGGLVQQGYAQNPLSVLSPGRPVEGVITKQPHAYGLNLVAGQFLRLKGEGDRLLLRLIGPRGDTLQLNNTLMLSQVVQETGLHRLDIDRWYGLPVAQRSVALPYKLRVDELLSPARYAARLDSLRSDPRVAWLAQHAIPLRSLATDDDDFNDLRPLREAIGDARVVLLGEESHGSGNIIRAKSRLVRFLHQEMGFDVVAFESSLYFMWKVWQLMQAGHDPGVWSYAADFQPLARYLGQQAVGPHPLEVSGVDFQFSGDLSSQQLVSELRELVDREHLGEEGKNLVKGFWTTLSGFVSGTSQWHIQQDVLSDLRLLAERLAGAGETRSAAEGRTLRMWAQVSRSLAEYMAFDWIESYNDRRDRQMDRNLAWLGREYFPGRKIIVWAANVHVLRHPNRLPQATIVSTVGMDQAVREVFSDRSFVIVATAYSGQYRMIGGSRTFTVMSDQDPTFELEELMAATGLEQAVVPLRNLPAGGDWLRSPIFCRIFNYKSILGTWPDHADAILFMRAATPTIRIPR